MDNDISRANKSQKLQIQKTSISFNNNCWGFKPSIANQVNKKRQSDMIVELYNIRDVDKVDCNTSWQGNPQIIEFLL